MSVKSDNRLRQGPRRAAIYCRVSTVGQVLHNKVGLHNKGGGCTISQVGVMIEFRLSIDKEIYAGNFWLETFFIDRSEHRQSRSQREYSPCIQRETQVVPLPKNPPLAPTAEHYCSSQMRRIVIAENSAESTGIRMKDCSFESAISHCRTHAPRKPPTAPPIRVALSSSF